MRLKGEPKGCYGPTCGEGREGAHDGCWSSPTEDRFCGPIVMEVAPLTVVEPVNMESEDSTESTRLITQKRRKLGKHYFAICVCIVWHSLTLFFML